MGTLRGSESNRSRHILRRNHDPTSKRFLSENSEDMTPSGVSHAMCDRQPYVLRQTVRVLDSSEHQSDLFIQNQMLFPVGSTAMPPHTSRIVTLC